MKSFSTSIHSLFQCILLFFFTCFSLYSFRVFYCSGFFLNINENYFNFSLFFPIFSTVFRIFFLLLSLIRFSLTVSRRSTNSFICHLQSNEMEKLKKNSLRRRRILRKNELRMFILLLFSYFHGNVHNIKLSVCCNLKSLH